MVDLPVIPSFSVGDKIREPDKLLKSSPPNSQLPKVGPEHQPRGIANHHDVPWVKKKDGPWKKWTPASKYGHFWYLHFLGGIALGKTAHPTNKYVSLRIQTPP